jgi:hypothetical protein
MNAVWTDTMKRVIKELVRLVLILLLWVQESELSEQAVYCPSQCVCTKVRSRSAGDFKLKCGGGDGKIFSVEELNLQDFPLDIFHL